MTRLREKLFSVSDASVRAGGVFISFSESDPDILSVSIDSRSVSKGDLFIALNGEFTDGHNFISMALEAGATGAMISKEYYAVHMEEFLKHEACFVVVENTLFGLQKLAAS